MLTVPFDLSTLAFVIVGALFAGFTTGFAGFGTGLVASGLWFHALPAPMVPPLVAMAAVAGQLVGFVTVRKAFDWRRVSPFLMGGTIGVPLGVGALASASPTALKVSVGAFLVIYAIYRLAWKNRFQIDDWGGRIADSAIGTAGGFLGGFAGLSGPLPLIWLQLRGGPSEKQRATYQPFNLIVLAFAGVSMALAGQITVPVVQVAAFCLPATLAGAWLGARIYVGVSEQAFQRIVLCLLLVSGAILIVQTAG